MVYFFDKDLKIVEIKTEVSFSYNKKANREGSGKIEVFDIPNPESLYVSILHNKEYITSGFITEIQIGNKAISISFNTFEALLKNYKLPKIFNSFKGMSEKEIITNLFYSFFPIIKSKKTDFSQIVDNYGQNASSLPNVLYAENIVFAKIKDGDLHLDFDVEEEKKNNFRYAKEGTVVFTFDLGKPSPIKNIINNQKEGADFYAQRYLRFTASLGSKTFIRVKAIEKDTQFEVGKWDAEYKKLFEKASYLKYDRSIKDYEKNIGIPLPSKYQYLAIQFTFIYDKPNYIQDFSTLEVYQKDGAGELSKKLVKRTVRGFTPVLHGFEVLNRCLIKPFNKIIFEGVYEKENPFNKKLSLESADIKLGGVSLYEALIKVLEYTHLNIAIEAKPLYSPNFVLGDVGLLSVYVFSNDENIAYKKHGFDKTQNEKTIFRLQEKEASRFNNYLLKTIKKKICFFKVLYYYGKGDGQDIIHCCLFNNIEKEEGTGKLKEVIYYYSPLGINSDSALGKFLLSQGLIATNIMPTWQFQEESIDSSNIETLEALITTAKKHFVGEKKEEDFSFEVDSDLNVRLFDKVLVLHQLSNLQLKARIIEEKISIKQNKMTKTFGIGGFLFNPFESLFQKAPIDRMASVPQKPFNLKAFIQDGYLNLVWDCSGLYDGFCVNVERLDGQDVSKNIEEKIAYFHSQTRELKLNAFDLKTLYVLNITSHIGNVKSVPSISLYFKVTDDIKPVRILNSLLENGSKEGELGFYIDIEWRNNEETKKTIQSILKIDNVYLLNDISNIDKNVLNDLSSYEEEIIRKFLGIEYVWNGKEWVDSCIKLPSIAPLFYFDFSKKHLSENCDVELIEKGVASYKQFMEALKRFEDARQILSRLSFEYQLPYFAPEAGGGTIYSIGRERLEPAPPINPFPPTRPLPPEIEKPPRWGGDKDPSLPPIGPNPPKPKPPIDEPPYKPDPPHGNADNRKPPTIEIKKMWDSNYAIYEKLREELPHLFEKAKDEYLDEYFESKEKHFFIDLSPNKNNMEFNLPIFQFLKNVEIKDSNENPFDRFTKSLGNVFLGNAFNFLWCSTIKDGSPFKWGEKKPYFHIEKLSGYSENGGRIGTVAGQHTIAFYLIAQGDQEETELWNFGNYNVGLLKGDELHFGFKTKTKKTNSEKEIEEFHSLYKHNIYVRGEDPTLSFKPKEEHTFYLHIMVEASFYIDNLYSSIDKSTSPISITQKIFINFDEVKKIEKNVYAKLADKHAKFSLFNFKEKTKEEEEMLIKKAMNENTLFYQKSPFFNVNIAHLLIFPHWLTYGERKALEKTVSYPFKELVVLKGDNKTQQGEASKEEASIYKGVCIDDVKDDSSTILINSKSIVLKEGEFFLMGKNKGAFKAGYLYAWKDGKWTALLPFQEYHNEYLMAYNDIFEMRGNLNDIFFKEFVINALQFSEMLYSNALQVNKMVCKDSLIMQNGVINDSLIFKNLPNEDPHVKGKVYISIDNSTGRSTLAISNG